MQEELKYFGHTRYDVLMHVPDDVTAILSLGCGYGQMEKTLIEKGCSVLGIEPDQEAASVAAANGLEVINSTAEEGIKTIQDRQFDCLLLSDVLEHLVDPAGVFTACSNLLSEGGTVVVSIPNFRHVSVFYELFIKGMAPENDAGIFDRTHLRMTTKKLIEKWFSENNISVSEHHYNLPGRIQRAASFLSFGIFNEIISRQVVICGKKPE